VLSSTRGVAIAAVLILLFFKYLQNNQLEKLHPLVETLQFSAFLSLAFI